MIDKRIGDFLDELASDAPTPGGGGAAAIMGAMAASLVSMVCRLTIGKKGYEQFGEEMQGVLAEAEHLRLQLQPMVKRDAEVFDQVMTAYRMPKGTEAENQIRSAAIQGALRTATEVPLGCARACSDLIRLSRIAAEHGNRNVVSDAGVAVMAAYAGLKSAALNVYVNSGALHDKAFANASVAEIESLLTRAEGAAAETFSMTIAKL
jgi:formiminotetrahydrofolate cyclodeaminase